MKLFKLFIIGLKKKYNDEAVLLVTLYFFPDKQLRYNIYNPTYLNFLELV